MLNSELNAQINSVTDLVRELTQAYNYLLSGLKNHGYVLEEYKVRPGNTLCNCLEMHCCRICRDRGNRHHNKGLKTKEAEMYKVYRNEYVAKVEEKRAMILRRKNKVQQERKAKLEAKGKLMEFLSR